MHITKNGSSISKGCWSPKGHSLIILRKKSSLKWLWLSKELFCKCVTKLVSPERLPTPNVARPGEHGETKRIRHKHIKLILIINLLYAVRLSKYLQRN